MDNSKTFILVVGMRGSGKSSFICKHAKDPHNVKVGNGVDCVTQYTEFFESKDDPNICFIDTVGLEKRIGYDKLLGKKIFVVAICNELRSAAFKEDVDNEFPPGYKVKFYSGRNTTPSDEMPSIDKFQLSDVKMSTVLFPLRRVTANARTSPSEISAKPKPQNATESIMFGKNLSGGLSDCQKALVHMAKKSTYLMSRKPRKVNYEMITTMDDVKDMRIIGEHMLEIFMIKVEQFIEDLERSTTNASSSEGPEKRKSINQRVQKMMSNESLEKLPGMWNIEPHVQGLYNITPDEKLSPEKRADYVEALFGYIYENDKRMVVPLFLEIYDGVQKTT